MFSAKLLCLCRYYLEEDDYYDENEFDGGEIPDREVCCFVRAFPGELEKDMLQCDVLDQAESTFRVQEHEELISELTTLSSKDGMLNLLVSLFDFILYFRIIGIISVPKLIFTFKCDTHY